MDKRFWIERWETNNIGFHHADVNPFLSAFLPDLLHDKGVHTIFLPLCGKSIDLVYLAKLGHKVIGVELSPLAVEAFFRENSLTYKITQDDSWSGKIFNCQELPIHLLQGDFFSLSNTGKILGPLFQNLDRAYDRAALIALPAELRARYLPQLRKLVPPTQLLNFRYLMITLEYGGNRQDLGPPFSVSTDEVALLACDAGLTFSQLKRESHPTNLERFASQGVTSMTDTVLLGTFKVPDTSK
jgi:thiopurine S-methyltransferase